ncbi:hypothetical protein HYW74_04900 [Candidatus Pacearchaeota archaeon]|nr:hypothetical protein [Candidatus Pacearchaeota archaeon]
MNKKAILMPEVLKIILGVLGIIVLFGLAIGLYGIFMKTDIQLAKTNLNKIEKVITGLKEGQTEEYLLLNPRGWALITWPSDYTYLYTYQRVVVGDNQGGEIFHEGTLKDSKPHNCRNWEKCLCFCQYDPTGNYKTMLDNCDKLSVCKEIKNFDIRVNSDGSLEKDQPIYIDDLINNKEPITLSLKNNKIYITSGNENK